MIQLLDNQLTQLFAQQQVQPTLTPMAPNGMPAQPVAAQIPNPAVYGNQQVMNTGMAMYGSPEMRQSSVAYMKSDLDKDRTIKFWIEANAKQRNKNGK